MKYQEFLDYIYQRHSGNVKLGLDRMYNILQAMGEPNRKLKGIHVAGTNGKGSTSAMCEAMALEYGMKTGLNTSPHLVDYRERIRVNGKNISLDELIENYKQWETVLEENEASFFEITTAMAFYHFLKNQIDTAIFEVGLGGRLDGTNPFQSTVSVITTISFDHTKSLGDSIEKIAYEKGGIIKDNTPLIIGKMDDTAKSVIRKIAAEKNAPIMEFDKDFRVENIRLDETGTHFDYISENLKIKNVTVNLLGQHQAYNAAVAITAFSTYLKQLGLPVNAENILLALKKINWPGRMQILSTKPTVLIDGAHNEEGITALTRNLKQIFPDKKIHFVLAILRDKNLEKIIRMICDISDKLYISKNKSTRAAEIEDQAEIARQYNANFVTIDDVVKAAKIAQEETDQDDLVVISGSLYTISEVLKVKDEMFPS